LTHLAHSNQEIQKIVAFEGAFEKLFFVIDAEVPPSELSLDVRRSSPDVLVFVCSPRVLPRVVSWCRTP
jgi:hypothetical protein